MGATSVTGIGAGSADKPNIIELSTIAQGPAIFAAGSFDAQLVGDVSPATPGGTVIFASLPGASSDYSIHLTTTGGGSAYVDELVTDDSNALIGFSFFCTNEGTVYYAVIQNGIRTIS